MSSTLKETRLKMGLSLAELANKTGIGRSTLGNYETGRARMSLEKIRHLAACLKTPVDEVAPGEPSSVAPPGPSSPAAGTAATCRIPADCDLPARLNELRNQMAEVKAEMDDIRKLLISLLAEERGKAANPPEMKEASKAG